MKATHYHVHLVEIIGVGERLIRNEYKLLKCSHRSIFEDHHYLVMLFHLMSVNVSAASLSLIRGNVHIQTLSAGMNAAVRATVRVGLYTGAKVYFVHEVNTTFFSL